MKKYPLSRALLAGAIALSVTGTMTAVPAHAQFGFGGIVYDPTNYASNVLQAARALQQINNQNEFFIAFGSEQDGALSIVFSLSPKAPNPFLSEGVFL